MKRGSRLIPLAGALVILVGCQARDQEITATQSSEPSSGRPAGELDNPNAELKIVKTDAEWKNQLTPEQYHVLRQAGTERPFGKTYEEFNQQGMGAYSCAGCGAELFSSNEKFDSHCGWPSFYDPANARNVVTRDDFSLGTVRTEVLCAQCGGHLGHVFKGEGYKTPTDLRYCINGVALKFEPAVKDASK